MRQCRVRAAPLPVGSLGGASVIIADPACSDIVRRGLRLYIGNIHGRTSVSAVPGRGRTTTVGERAPRSIGRQPRTSRFGRLIS